MNYNPQIHHRRSIRLKDYDYSLAGAYFITICCKNMICRFGNIVYDEMELNKFGQIANEEWIKLTDRFSNFELDVFQVMPNHMHGIILLTNSSECKNTDKKNFESVSNIVGSYKSIVSNKCLEIYKLENLYMGKLWQRNFHDHIIRNEYSYRKIAEYIMDNPKNWNKDNFYRD